MWIIDSENLREPPAAGAITAADSLKTVYIGGYWYLLKNIFGF